MGSRVQFYLHADSSKDFLVTRSGHKSKINSETKLLLDYWSKKTFDIFHWKDIIILDGELMPWGAIGQELINREFIPYVESYLKENEVLLQDKIFSQFPQFTNYNLNWNIQHLQIFKKQIQLYGQYSSTYYCPFNILKLDSQIYPFTSNEVFLNLNNNINTIEIDFSVLNYLQIAEKFFKEQTIGDNPLEGIIVKPFNDKDIYNYAPYMKVRNENYLHIVYGYDFQLNYDKMCKQKNIGKKLHLSIQEYILGKKMLSSTKEELAELTCEMLFKLKQEEELDIRL